MHIFVLVRGDQVRHDIGWFDKDEMAVGILTARLETEASTVSCCSNISDSTQSSSIYWTVLAVLRNLDTYFLAGDMIRYPWQSCDESDWSPPVNKGDCDNGDDDIVDDLRFIICHPTMY